MASSSVVESRSSAEVVTVEAAAGKAGQWWVVDAAVDGRLIAVHVRSLDHVDAVVNQALAKRGMPHHPPVRVHIYWFHP